MRFLLCENTKKCPKNEEYAAYSLLNKAIKTFLMKN